MRIKALPSTLDLTGPRGFFFVFVSQALSAKVKEKTGITSRLTELIMASEKQRDAKLNEIMKKMSTDGGGQTGGAAGGRGGAAR